MLFLPIFFKGSPSTIVCLRYQALSSGLQVGIEEVGKNLVRERVSRSPNFFLICSLSREMSGNGRKDWKNGNLVIKR